MNVGELNVLSDRVIIRPIEAAKESTGGIVIPDVARARIQDETRRGIVVAMGPGKFGKKDYLHKRLPMPDIAVGDFVEYDHHFQGVPVVFDGVEHRSVRSEDILAVYEE